MVVKKFALLFFLGCPIFGMAQNAQISVDSLNRYFKALNKDSLFTYHELGFLLKNTTDPQSLPYKFLANNSERVNKVMGDPQAVQLHFEEVVGNEGIDQLLWTNKDRSTPINEKPNWSKISAIVAKKYGKQYIQRPLLDAKIRWYEYKRDYDNQIKFTIQRIENSGLDTSGMGRASLNNLIYELIFMYGTDTAALKKGLEWQKIIIDSEKTSANHIDTYANLLYKLKRRDEAIRWQEKALALDPRNPELRRTLEKMKSDIPTWFVNN